ncbi:peptidoglycan-binding protein [uncultured Microscilla sp.]|uniref:peptidoglycan recognition protein family protein n=1 Tax=uncultured Microscilla sp. TaxID=432653 RepID=UPI00260F0AB3|nr:peptidoglycan-binding protein [uncultured Microscilla sp.]
MNIILKIGDKGDQVRWLQRKLRIMDDGWFGVITEKAVKDYQRENDLLVDGIAGPKTLATLGLQTGNAAQWICVHVSATPENATSIDARWVKNYHMGIMKWNKPGYHFVIEQDGTLVELWKLDLSDGIQKQETTYGIGGWRDAAAVNICLIGGLNSHGQPKDTRTPEQRKTLDALTKALLKEAPAAKLVGHNQFWNKACPCFSVPKWAKETLRLKDENIETQDPFGYARTFNA